MLNLKQLVVSTKKLTSTSRREIDLAGKIMNIKDKLSVSITYDVIDDLMKDLPIKRKGFTKYIDLEKLFHDMNWGDNDWVHISFTDRDWKKIGLSKRNYGHSKVITYKGVKKLITYGRWNERSRYQQSHKMPKPYNRIPEQTLGIWHEGTHGFSYILGLGKTAWTHSFFYGYSKIYSKSDEKRLKPKRYAKKPDPRRAWDSLPWHKLNTPVKVFSTTQAVPVVTGGINYKNRDDVLTHVKKYFKISELVPKIIVTKHGERAWRIFPTEVLANLLYIRVASGRSMTVNGRGMQFRGYDSSGYRSNESISYHCFARAFDFDLKGFTPSQSRQWIRENYQNFPYPHVRIEVLMNGKEITWCHVDFPTWDSGLVEFNV